MKTFKLIIISAFFILIAFGSESNEEESGVDVKEIIQNNSMLEAYLNKNLETDGFYGFLHTAPISNALKNCLTSHNTFNMNAHGFVVSVKFNNGYIEVYAKRCDKPNNYEYGGAESAKCDDKKFELITRCKYHFGEFGFASKNATTPGRFIILDEDCGFHREYYNFSNYDKIVGEVWLHSKYDNKITGIITLPVFHDGEDRCYPEVSL